MNIMNLVFHPNLRAIALSPDNDGIVGPMWSGLSDTP